MRPLPLGPLDFDVGERDFRIYPLEAWQHQHFTVAISFAYDPAPLASFRYRLQFVLESAQHALVGATWTTDAPFRETTDAIDLAKSKGVLAVEMEAAALYAFAASAEVQVICLAHVTNTMGQAGDDFEKGEADGTRDALAVLARLVETFRALEDK